MANYKDQLSILRNKEDDAEKVKLCENLIQEAQRLKDEDLEYEVRKIYMRAVTLHSEYEKTLANFPWLLAYADKHEEKFSGKMEYFIILWYYKWTIDKIASFSSISRERILSIAKDMEERFIANGESLKPVHKCLRGIYQELGEPDIANEFSLKAETGEWTMLEDCTACQINSNVSYEAWKGNHKMAIEIAEDLLSGKHTCESVPSSTYSTVLKCYCYLNKMEKGVDICTKALTAYGKDKSYLSNYGDVLKYLAITKNFVEAKEAFINQIDIALNNKCDRLVLSFYIGVLIYFHSLVNENKTELTLPSTIKLPVQHQDNTYQVIDLRNFFDKEVDRITEAFNKRNGNTYYSSFKSDALGLLKNTRAVSLVR